MKSPSARRLAGVFVVAAVALGVARGADEARAIPTAKSPGTTTSKAGPRSAIGKGPLPDPVLLDGSTQPKENRPEHGMIGDFELPGDENARTDRVGGPSGGGGKGQQQQQQQPGVSVSLPPIPGLPSLPGQQGGGIPGGGGGLGILNDPTKQGAGAGQGAGISAANTGGGAPGGASSPPSAAIGNESSGTPPAGGGAAGGMQVGQITGEAGGQDAGGGGASKPAAVTIGDSAMRIEPSANPAANQPGQQVAGQTQQHEKGTGSGGKGAGGAQSGNRIERGRAIPSGL